MVDQGLSGPGKYVLEMHIDVTVTDPLQLATQNMALNQQDDGGRGVEALNALLMDRFAAWHRLLNGQDLGFTVGGGTFTLHTQESYDNAMPEPMRSIMRKEHGYDT